MINNRIDPFFQPLKTAASENPIESTLHDGKATRLLLDERTSHVVNELRTKIELLIPEYIGIEDKRITRIGRRYNGDTEIIKSQAIPLAIGSTTYDIKCLIDSSNNLFLTAVNSLGEDVLFIRFNNKNDKWVLDFPIETDGFNLNFGYPLERMLLETTSALVFLNILESKYLKRSTGSSSENCIGHHDLACSWFATPSGYVKVAGIPVNVYDCCLEHDIDLWCSQNYFQVTGANLKVVDCIYRKILEAIHKLPWYLAPYGLVVGAIVTVLYVVGLVGSLIGEWWIDRKYTNYDGYHTYSCLCEGSEITTCCPDIVNNANRHLCLDSSGNLRNLCGVLRKEATCYGCIWVHKPWGSNPCFFQRDPEGKLPCCPGTEIEMPDECKPCADCYWRKIGSRCFMVNPSESTGENKLCCPKTPGTRPVGCT